MAAYVYELVLHKYLVLCIYYVGGILSSDAERAQWFKTFQIVTLFSFDSSDPYVSCGALGGRGHFQLLLSVEVLSLRETVSQQLCQNPWAALYQLHACHVNNENICMMALHVWYFWRINIDGNLACIGVS